ncbi:MAG: hypothetical protein ABWZ27_07965 [Aestuariivirgaceae bacterium]
MLRIASLFVALLFAPPLAFAQDAPDSEGGRYVLEKAGDGFIRLDRQTGAVSRCLGSSGSWTCESIDDNRSDDPAGLKAEVDRLQRQNDELKKRIADLEKRPGDSAGGTRIELPTQQDMDRFMALVESWMRKFVEFARSLGQEAREKQNI